MALESDKIILNRSELLEFFGKMALPPWIDEKGKQIGSKIPCAPIASEISDWLDEHSTPWELY